MNAVYSSPRAQGSRYSGCVKDSEDSSGTAACAVVNRLWFGWKLPGPASNAGVGEMNLATQKTPWETPLSCKGHEGNIRDVLLTENQPKQGHSFNLGLCWLFPTAVVLPHQNFSINEFSAASLSSGRRHHLPHACHGSCILCSLRLVSPLAAFACCLFSSLNAHFQGQKLGCAPLFTKALVRAVTGSFPNCLWCGLQAVTAAHTGCFVGLSGAETPCSVNSSRTSAVCSSNCHPWSFSA